MLEDLIVPCAHTPADSLRAVNEPAFSTGRVAITVNDHGVTANTLLDEAGARALFNWLGVWLHTRP